MASAVATLLACIATAGCGSGATVGTLAPGGVAQPAHSGTPFRFFSPSSVFNKRLSARAPLDPRSARLVAIFAAEVAREETEDALVTNIPWINIDTTSYSVPIYTVPANQPTVEVALKGGRARTLIAAWSAVPLPSNAQAAVGTDGHLVVWQPSTNRLWEFWRLVHGTEGWYASWGGAMQNVSHASGVYGPRSWPGAQATWGGSASSLSVAGGVITFEDLEKGQINHALAMAIPNVRAGVYSSPAQRTDGSDHSVLALPEGAHLRLDPRLDLAKLHLPRLTRMMAEAAQRYGIYVRDGAPVVAFYGQDPTPTGTNPYIGPHGYFEGKEPRELLAAFPWRHLQLLKMDLHADRRRHARIATGAG